MPVLLTKTAVALYVTALVALVATTFYVTPEPSSETYLACASDVHDADTSPAPCAGIGTVFHDGDVLADLSTSYERVKAVIARARFHARYEHFVRTGDPARLEDSAREVEQAEDHVIRAQGMGVVRRIHATRSIRAKSGFFFSLVTEPGQLGPTPLRPSVVGLGLGPATRRILDEVR
jgi:hypothetical protein